jgi:SAM-dependent methyltransferase
MIKETTCYLEEHGQKNLSARGVDASDLQLPQGALDFVSTFNAIHHFAPVRLFNHAREALKAEGYVFVYAPFLSSCLKSWIELHYMV